MSFAITEKEIKWSNVIVLLLYHYIALEGLYYWITLQVQWKTLFFNLVLAFFVNMALTAGVHRLWCHKSYKAKLPLRIFLCFFQTMAFQNSIYEWSRDHRVHHKFTDTDADPHNSNRGFFFSHMGWLMVRKHPDVKNKGKTVDMSDLKADPIVAFQHKYYAILAPLLGFIVPSVIPWYYWKEKFYFSFCISMLRYMFSLHSTWSVNSVAHMWGTKPYDRNIRPVENRWVSYITSGEGWHNYHHTFPWDYKAAELDKYSGNLTVGFIDLMAKLGLAYDLKTASEEMIRQRVEKTGDDKYFILIFFVNMAITAGVHRLWSHKSYKAKLPLRLFLCFFQTMGFQNSIYEWSRDHRVHHKFTDTDADPHNSNRGFFFSHMGWLMVRKHPDVKNKGKTVDMSDLKADPIVAFQHKYYAILAPLLCFIMPSVIPWYYWKEKFYISFCISMFRYMFSLHSTWSVNSVAHMWGTKPYDRNIRPAENRWVSYITSGEGWHNYHHTFPWDYKSAELDKYSGNLTAGFIDLMAKLGLAYDLRTASKEMIRQRMEKTGDGSVNY